MVGVWRMQEANSAVGNQPERPALLGSELIGGNVRYPRSGWDCPEGVYGQHVPRYGEPHCFLCGKRVDIGKRVEPKREQYIYDEQPEYLEPDDSDYHDFPDHLSRWSSRTDLDYASRCEVETRVDPGDQHFMTVRRIG